MILVFLGVGFDLRLIISVDALEEIGRTLGKTDWDFTADPCGGVASGWISKSNQFDTNFDNNVTCKCNFQNNTVCHVTNMYVLSPFSLFFFVKLFRYQS